MEHEFYPQPIWIKSDEDRVKQFPRRIFDGSAVFADMFDQLPQDSTKPRDGDQEEQPFALKLTMPDLILFARASEAQSLDSSPNLTVQEWIVVLRLTTMWLMEGLRAFAIDALETHFESSCEHAASQVRAGLDHRVDGWASAGTKRLVCQADPMSAGDITILEPAIVALILKHRQRAFHQERESIIHQARRRQHCHLHKNSGFIASCSDCVPRTMLTVGMYYLSLEEQQELDKEAGPIIQQLTKM